MRYFWILFLTLLVSCRNDVKLIPEEELGDIIVQSIVAESFLRNTDKLYHNDSLSFYLPILDQYGYTPQDVDYTIERMVQRKSNVFGQLMDKISADVRKIKDVYESQSNMNKKWVESVRREAVDTLFFSPDSIVIQSVKDLKMLDYRVPINRRGEIVVSYNYLITERDSNYSRYMLYSMRDTISKRQRQSNNYWISKNDATRKFEKEIAIGNPYASNQLDIRLFSYFPSLEKNNTKSLRTMEVYLDSVLIVFRPELEKGKRKLMDRLLHSPVFIDIHYAVKDTTDYLPPYTMESRRIVKYDQEFIRYDRNEEKKKN